MTSQIEEKNAGPDSCSREYSDNSFARPLRVFVMDFFCSVPYYTVQLCKALRERGIYVCLGSATYDLDPACFHREGVENSPGLLDFAGKYRIRPAFVRRIVKVCEACVNMSYALALFLLRRPDLVHIQQLGLLERGWPMELWFLRGARRLDIRMVLTVHNLLPHDTGSRFRDSYRKLYHEVDFLVCHTTEAKERLTREFGVSESKISVIPHGPLFHQHSAPAEQEARRTLGIDTEECIILYQGFLKPYKGINFLLNAWKNVQAKGLRARLLIAGGGDSEQVAAVQGEIGTLGIERSVIPQLRYLSADEVATVYQAADVVVYPYRQITTSGALMTGVARRKPIVATDHPAFREVLEHGINGLLTPYGDVNGLASALTCLIENPMLRSKLSANLPAVTSDSEFSWTAIADQTIRCYQSLENFKRGRELCAE